MIITVVGARPQFIKAAVLSNELRVQHITEKIIHTGQHYDYKMSEVFFEELGLPGIETNLNIGSGPHGQQTAEMLTGIEKTLVKHKNDISGVLLYGDTNSTLAGALAAAKLHIPIFHVEAGLRSFNKKMPEEINRIMTDHLSSLMFCSSPEGKKNLFNEGITSGVFVSGDIMLDAFNTYSAIAQKSRRIDEILPEKLIDNYILLTIHRPDNTDSEKNLTEIFAALSRIEMPIVWPVHPRNENIIRRLKIPSNITVFKPFSYFEMILALKACKKVVTDSGGLQKEAYWAKKPCVTVRSETEWIETLHDGWNILTAPNREAIIKAVTEQVADSTWYNLYGNGTAAEEIVKVIKLNYGIAK